jgi:hypothetical protein
MLKQTLRVTPVGRAPGMVQPTSHRCTGDRRCGRCVGALTGQTCLGPSWAGPCPSGARGHGLDADRVSRTCDTSCVDSTEPPYEVAEASLRVTWDSANSLPVVTANQFAVTLGLPSNSGRPDGIYLLVGHLAPPTVVGSVQEVREFTAASGGKIDVAVHGKYLITRDRLQELLDTLASMAKKYDEAVAKAKAGEMRQ